MACKSCTSGACGSSATSEAGVSGCQSNGRCGTGACNKMNVFDWLSDLDVPSFQRYSVVELKLKGGRKEYVRNADGLMLHTGDAVVFDTGSGHHVGVVSLQGELVRLQLLKKGIKDNDQIKSILRLANEKDLDKHQQAMARDMPTLYRSREIIQSIKLNMKLSDVEFQSDGNKATFYYSSEDRVDFRELIKLLAAEFKIRVEMKQISLRQEASRLGGIGICGRELCCSTWLTDFKNVTTSAARYQNLSLNPVKLSGQCGRLKCCLNYELETYMDALKSIPQVEGRLKVRKGDAILQKTDIFKRMMWFGIVGEESHWIPVSCDRVAEVIALNKQGIIPESFEDLNPEGPSQEKPSVSELNSDLERMNKKYANKRTNPARKGNPKRRPDQPGGQARGQRPNHGPQPNANPNGNPNANPNPGSPANPEAKDNAQRQGQKKKKFRPRPPRQGGNPGPSPA